jgi:hypothetical protein
VLCLALVAFTRRAGLLEHRCIQAALTTTAAADSIVFAHAGTIVGEGRLEQGSAVRLQFGLRHGLGKVGVLAARTMGSILAF